MINNEMKGHIRDTLHFTIEEKLLMFLHTIEHNQPNRAIGHNFVRFGETISRYFNYVQYAIGKLRDEYVHPSNTQNSAYIALRSTVYSYFKVLINFQLTLNLLSYNQFLVIMC